MLQEQRQTDLQQLINNSKNLTDAYFAMTLDTFLQVLNSEAYLNFVEHAQDSSSVEADEQRRLISEVQSRYRRLLDRVKEFPHELRNGATSTIDSFQQMLEAADLNERVSEIVQVADLSAFERWLFFSRRFELGMSQLPSEQFASIGLPINGLNYAYDNNKVALEVTWGRQNRSDRFLPQQGVLLQDLQPSRRFRRVGLNIGGEASSHEINLSFISAKDIIDNDDSGVLFPRKNRVWSLHFRSNLGDNWSIKSDFSWSDTQLSTSTREPSATARYLAWRVANAFQLGSWGIETGVFRVGDAFESFANPYLLTNYQGADVKLVAGSTSGKLSGQLQLSIGTDADQSVLPAESQQLRWQGQGYLSYRLGKASILGLMVAPNFFRRSQEELSLASQANIYRFDYRLASTIAERPFNAYLAVSNLNTGWNWNDSLQVNNSLNLNADFQYQIGEDWALQANTLQVWSLGADQSPMDQWAYSIGGSYQAGIQLSAQIRYDKYPNEILPALGGRISLQTNLGRFGQLSVMFNLRYTQLDRTQLFGYQNWLANL
ncbi:MAG: hypothetical protein AAF433_11305 [Bacteroidota bacterium]